MARRRREHICECGRSYWALNHHPMGCEHCRASDAAGSTQAELEHQLLSGPQTVAELMGKTGMTRRSVQQCLTRLVGRGRVRKIVPDQSAVWYADAKRYYALARGK